MEVTSILIAFVISLTLTIIIIVTIEKKMAFTGVSLATFCAIRSELKSLGLSEDMANVCLTTLKCLQENKPYDESLIICRFEELTKETSVRIFRDNLVSVLSELTCEEIYTGNSDEIAKLNEIAKENSKGLDETQKHWSESARSTEYVIRHFSKEAMLSYYK